MVTSKIQITLFIIAAIAVRSTLSLPLHSFIGFGTEDVTTMTLVSTPWSSVRSEFPPPPTTTAPMPDSERGFKHWQDMPEAWMAIVMGGLFALFVVYYIAVRLLECCHGCDLGRKFYWMFRDNVCCGCCVRRMKRGKLYEYEEI